MDSKVKKDQRYAGVYQEMVDLFGPQFVAKLYANYRGQQVVFPMRLYTKEYVAEVLKERYDGTNLKALALEFGYTERYLRTIIKSNM